jgi:hypothetical protein
MLLRASSSVSSRSTRPRASSKVSLDQLHGQVGAFVGVAEQLSRQ